MPWIGRTGDESRDLWECDACGNSVVLPVDGDNPLPEGFHIRIQRIYKKTNSLNTDDKAYYCDKTCLLRGIQFHNYG